MNLTANPQKNTLLQAATSYPQTKAHKRVFFSAAQQKITWCSKFGAK